MSIRRPIAPEADLLILSFPMHFTWELLQAPLFSSMEKVTHIDGIRICLQATLGDMVIALVAYWVAALLAGTRHWVGRPDYRAFVLFIGTGLGITVGIEFLSTEVLERWTYGTAMPRLPFIGTGLTPILQWALIPALVLWYMHRLSSPHKHLIQI